MALSDTSIRAAKPKQAQYKLYDDSGLVLLVRPSGGKRWRLKYRFGGKEKQLSIGRYPDVSLRAARERRDLARKLIAAGKDPGTEKKQFVGASATDEISYAAKLLSCGTCANKPEKSEDPPVQAIWNLERLPRSGNGGD